MVAAAHPEKPLLLARGEKISYADAVASANRYAGALDAAGAARFAVYLENSPALVLLLLAAARHSAEVCVLNREHTRAEVEELVRRLELTPLVVREPLGIAGVREIPLAHLEGGIGTDRDPEDAPVLVLTTGTTGKPKAARYTWATLAKQIRQRADQASARWLLAYNLNHFGGLQVLLHVLVNGSTMVLPESLRPADAVAAMEEFGVTHVSATPTFWRTAKAQIPAERLRALKLEQITLGAEAASGDLLAELRDWYPAAKIVHIFAATEVGSCFSVQDGRDGVPASILDRDESADVQFKIVDGELLIRSRHGMLGYHGESQLSLDDWRATGDLVELRGDRIHFVGRKSERINVGGVKVDPLPVEERVHRVPGVEIARVYGKPNAITGQIVAVDVVAAAAADRPALERGIRQACADLAPQARPRFVRFVDELETRNAKLLRRTS